MRLAFYEDGRAADFHPLTLTRPVFELVCGHFSVRERLLRRGTVSDWGALVRGYLAEAYRDEHPEARVNDRAWLEAAPTLLVNGRWLPDPEALANLHPDEAGFIDDVLVFLTLHPDEAVLLAEGGAEEVLPRLARTRRQTAATGKLLSRPWDLIDHNPRQIALDFAARGLGTGPAELPPQVAVLGPSAAVYVDPHAQIEPFVVLDVRNGPVSIDAGAVIQSFSRLEGPCHIGQGTRLYRAQIRGGTTIGPVCRVGGEVDASILHGYANKYHDGFLGHSYVGTWVNLGALTTNSDLKNDYSSVQVPLGGTAVDTGLLKVGCFIGDYTKTAIGSLFNTGSSIGVMCLVLPGGELLPKHIPSFCSIWHGSLAPGLPLERSLAAARVSMRRRSCNLTPPHERLLRAVYQMSHREREEALVRAQEKQLRTAWRA